MTTIPIHPAEHAAKIVGAARSCGTCSLCCKVALIPELAKPQGRWCAHCKPGKGGCSIYRDSARPSVCRTFTCAWVERDAMPEDLRPDLVHAYVSGLTTGDGISVHVDTDYPDTWRTGKLARFIDSVSKRGVKVAIAVGHKRFAIIRGLLVRGADVL